MARVVHPGGTVAITDRVEHEHEWLSTEQADVWLGFSRDSVAEMFAAAGLVEVDHALAGTTASFGGRIALSTASSTTRTFRRALGSYAISAPSG